MAGNKPEQITGQPLSVQVSFYENTGAVSFVISERSPDREILWLAIIIGLLFMVLAFFAEQWQFTMFFGQVICEENIGKILKSPSCFRAFFLANYIAL